jgi:hypothetical protein
VQSLGKSQVDVPLKKNVSVYGPLVLQEVEALSICRQSAYEGGKVVSPTHQLPLPPGDTPGTHQRLSRPQGHSVSRRINPEKKPNNPIGNRTSDLPAHGTVTQPNAEGLDLFILWTVAAGKQNFHLEIKCFGRKA